MRPIRLLSILATALGLLATSAVPAAGAAPVVERNVRLSIDVPAFLVCGDTSLDYHLEVRRTIAEYYGADGVLVRWDLHAHYFATLTDRDSGLVIRDDGTRRVTDDFRTMTTTVVGGAHHVTWPGGGLVFGEVGRLVFDWNGTPDNFDDDYLVFAAGIHQDAQVQALICSIAG